jgi:adenylate kinase
MHLMQTLVCCRQVSIEATKLFNRVWTQVVEKMGGFENLNIPKEIVWLNGAPGSGKGANTPFILQTRGFPTKAISISSLLQDDQQAQEIMKSGALLSDSHVLELVLEGILKMGFMDSPDEEGDEVSGRALRYESWECSDQG